MARYKAVKPANHAYRLTQKRERVRKTVDAVYTVFLLVGILVCGINQFRDLIVGWCLIVLGVCTIPVAAFHIYTDKKKWQPLLGCDDPEIKQYTDREAREKELTAYRFIKSLETVFLILFSIGFPVFGVLRLLGIV